MVTREQFIAWAKERGWTDDRYGHLQRTSRNGQYRLKLSSIAVRYERKVGSLGWRRISGNYFSKLTIDSGGVLIGME